MSEVSVPFFLISVFVTLISPSNEVHLNSQNTGIVYIRENILITAMSILAFLGVQKLFALSGRQYVKYLSNVRPTMV